MIKVVNKTKGIVVADRVSVAKSFWSRLKGLMFRSGMGENEGLIFYDAPSIHTFFMRFPIDVVFMDRQQRVVKISRALKPWRITSCFGSSLTLEIPANRSSAVSMESGDELEVVNS